MAKQALAAQWLAHLALASLSAAVGAFSQEHHNAGVNLVPQSPKGIQALLTNFCNRCGILERLMKPFRSSGERRAFFAGPVTDGDHEIEGLPVKLQQRLRSLARNVDTQLPHDRHCLRAHLSGVRTR